MSIFVNTYDPALNLLTINGFPINGIIGEIKVSEKEDRKTIVTDNSGTTSVVVKNNDRQATISFSVLENSISSSLLDGLVELDILFPVLYRNLSNGKGFSAPNCTVQKAPDIVNGKDGPQREYMFITPRVIRI